MRHPPDGETLAQEFPYQFPISNHSKLPTIVEWNTEHLGANAIQLSDEYGRAPFIYDYDPSKRWCMWYAAVWIKDDKDALLFKMRFSDEAWWQT